MDISRLVFLAVTGLIYFSAAFLIGWHSGVSRNGAHVFLNDLFLGVGEAFLEVSETSLITPVHFLKEQPGTDSGVVVNDGADDGELVLLSGFFDGDNGIRLIRRDGTVVAQWRLRFDEFFSNFSHLESVPATNWNVDTHGALALPDGSVVFNFEYMGMVKLGRCGQLAWALPHPTHHSVERAEAGGFWVPGGAYLEAGPSALPPFEAPYSDGLVLHVSEDGRILSQFSVAELMYRNGLEGLLTAHHTVTEAAGLPDEAERWHGEILHLNKVAELPAAHAAAFPQFAAGDLLLSLRNRNLLLVVDPVQQRIKWWQVGPWRRQHDPEFGPDGRISVFNNNAYANSAGDPAGPGPWHSNILIVDPATGRTETLFGDAPGQAFFSLIRGKHQILDDGLLVTVFETGTVIETDGAGKVVWKFVNRYDEEFLAEITEARLYPQDYFTVRDWSCPGS